MTPPRATGAILAAACLSVLGAGCRKPPAAAPSPVVATFSGGAVTAADVDQAVLDLPPQRRQPEDGDLLAWYDRIAHEVALQRLLLAEARKQGLDRDPEFLGNAADIRKQATVDAFLERDAPRPEPPSEAELRQFYDSHRSEFQVPEARLAQHLFRRVEAGADPRAAVAEVARLRARVLAGEDFSKLAEQHSDSETRHQKGLLGWVTAGQLAPDLDRIIFSLKVGVPSQPIPTRDGVHLFLVSAERPAKAYGFPEVRPLILRRLLGERWDALVKQRVGDTLPAGSFVLQGDELSNVLAAGDAEAQVARIGDFRLSLGELEQRLAALAAAQPAARSLSPESFLALLRQRELVYRYCLEHGLERKPDVEARERRLRDRELSAFLVRRKLAESLDRDPGRLEDYYRTNRARFSEPLRLRVQRLLVPLGGDSNRAMARLEASRGDLDRGRQTLAALAAAVGGRVEEPAWVTPSALARSDPRVARFVLELRPGQHAPPFRTETDLVMVRLLERREPVALSFEQARERVRNAYLASHRHELYTALSSEILDKAGFELSRPRLEEMPKRPPVALGGP